MKAIHKKRLLRCAEIMDSVPRNEFDMNSYFNDCGSPSCVLGHYDRATGNLKLKVSGHTKRTMDHFGIDIGEYFKMFVNTGCDGAKTPKQAAKYIRKFVKRKDEKDATAAR